jgi:hypothetical protein
MAIALLVAGSEAGEPIVGPETAAALRALGVSRISLLRDGSMTGVVLEGWAFRPADVGEATRAIFPAAREEIRTFHEVEHVGVPAIDIRRAT